MRKIITAASVGMLLIAGQAAASAGSSEAVSRIGDRVGASAGAAEDVRGAPMPVIALGVLVAISLGVIMFGDDSDSN